MPAQYSEILLRHMNVVQYEGIGSADLTTSYKHNITVNAFVVDQTPCIITHSDGIEDSECRYAMKIDIYSRDS